MERGKADVGALGYVGGDYTKKSAGDRYEFEQARRGQLSGSGYAKPEEFIEDVGLSTLSRAGARRLAVP